MHQISYFALSGQDEKSKYCGILEINDEIFILGAGIGAEITNQYGINKVIPDISYLAINKKKIKGIFLATPNNLNIGALPFFIQELQTVPIYTTEVGLLIIKTWFNQKSTTQFNKVELQPDVVVVKPLEWIQVGKTPVCPFKVFNSLPDSVGYVFKSKQGAIVFIDEFMVGSASRGHQNQLHYLPELTKKNVLALIVGLQNPTDNLGYAVPGYNTFGFIKKGVANAKKRVIVGCYDHDFLTIKNVIEVSKIYQLKLGIYSKRIHQMIDALVKMQYLDLTNLTVFPLDQVIDYDPNSVIILSGNYDRLFQNTYKVLSGEDSKLTFNPTDHFLLTIVTQPGLEVKEAQVTDDISCLDVSTKKLPHSTLLPIAGREDHRFLVNILKPKYVLPVYGFYKEYISYLEAIGSLIFRKNIIFLYNGERIIFHHKNHVKVVEEKISESYVNTKGVMEISSTILLERQNLNHYGLVAVSFVYDKNNNIFSPPQWLFKGLVSVDHFKLTDLKQLLTKVIKNELLKSLGFAKNEAINFKKLKLQLKKVILRTIERQLQKSPIVMLNIGLI